MPARAPLVIARRARWKPPAAGLRVDWAHPLSRGLLHAYLFNEGVGSPVNLVKRSQTVTLSSGATWTTSPYGPALHFNNSTTGKATLSSGFTPSVTAFSVDMAVRIGVAPASPNFEYLLGSQAAAGDGLLLTNSTTLQGWDFDSSTGDVATTVQPALNTWFHLVWVYQSTAAATIYQNGVSVATGALSGAFTLPLGWMGTDGTNAISNFGGDIAWLRIWDNRILTAGEAVKLYADPFAMLYAPTERARTFALLGGTVASGSVAIAGEADGIGTGTTLSLTVTKALTLESDGTGAATALSLTVTKALTLESDGTGTGTTLSLTVTKAIVGEADGVGTGTTLSLTVTKALTLEADGTGSATTLSLTVTKAIAGQTSGTGSATTLSLTVTKAIAAEADGVGTATTLTLTVGAGGVSITGSANGTGAATALTLTVSVAITAQASGSGTATALTLTISTLIVGMAVGSASATTLAITVGVVVTSTRIALTDAPLWSTALVDTPLWSTALADAPQAVTGLADAGQNATTLADAAQAQTVLSDA